jgi:hypothetical protein
VQFGSLSRTMGELPHLGALTPTSSGPSWEVIGADILHQQAVRGGPAIFFRSHWQLGNAAAYLRACGHCDVELQSGALQRHG